LKYTVAIAALTLAGNRGLVLPVCLGALTGCARFTGEPISPSGTAADFDLRRLSAKHARWTLSKLAVQAMEANPDLAVLRARVQTAEGALRTAGERPNPVLSFKPGYNSSTSGISPWIIEPGLDFTIETGGKRDARVAEAVARVRATRLELESAAWKVRGDVRRALLAMHGAQATRGQYHTHEAAQAEAARLLESQLKDGAATPQDVAVARIPLNQTRLSMHDTDMQAAKARGQLAAAIGVPVAALAGVDFDFAEITRMPSAPAGRAARRHALTHRADILAALADYAASEERLRLEIAKQYPDLKLGPGYKLDQNENKWTLGIGFEIPILNQHKGAIAEAEGKRAEAAARFIAVQARALAGIDVALAVYRAARAKAEAAGALAADVQAQTKAAETMKAAGEISQLAVSQRRVEHGAAELARVQARLQAFEAVGALEDALQTPATLWK
jgi:cobalt-zinc-cadmium efflux system outer membrane protein